MASVPSLHITAKAVSPGRSHSPLKMPFYEQPAGDSRALEVALARAAAHRKAALRKPRTEQSNVIAMAQAAIGKELAGLREEVMRMQTGEAITPPPRASHVFPLLQPIPEHPDMHPREQTSRPPSANQWDAEKDDMEKEIQRLKQIEISHASKTAAVRDLESRITNYSAALHQAESRLQQERASAAELKSIVEGSLRDRMKQLNDMHKQLKGHLLAAGYKGHTSFTDAKARADECLKNIDSDSGVQAFKLAWDKIKDYEAYVSQTQGTADKIIDDRLQSAKSESSSLEARLSSAEVRARHAEEELEDLKQNFEARHSSVQKEADEQLMALNNAAEAKLRDREKEIKSLKEMLNKLQDEQSGHLRQAVEKEQSSWKHQTRQIEEAHNAQLRKLEGVIKDLQNKLERQQQEIDEAVEKRMRSFEKEKRRLEEDARSAKEILTENLEVAQERAEDKIKALQEELAFQISQANARADLDRKKAAEEIGRVRQEAEAELRNVEKAFKKYKQRSEQDMDTQLKNAERDLKLEQQKVEALEIEVQTSTALIEETQSRCQELQNELRVKTEEMEAEIEKKAAALRQAESRLIAIAQASTASSAKGKSVEAELIKAEARIATLSDELASMRLHKGSSAEALEDARKHSTEASDQLADALARILEVEEKLSAKDVALQQAGAKAAMLDGCLAEATSSLTAAEEQIRLLTQTKNEYEKKAFQAMQTATVQETRAEELASLINEAQMKETKLLEHVQELEMRNHELEQETEASTSQLTVLQKETDELRGELSAIQAITSSHNEAQLATASYAEKVSSLAMMIEEKELQNIGMRKRIEELETNRLRDEGKVKLAEMRVVELKKSLQAAKLRIPELERKEDVQRVQIEGLQMQLKEMRNRAEARAAEAQVAIERAAMLEGRHKEALARQAALQKQVAQSLAQAAFLEETTASNTQELEFSNNKRSEIIVMLEASRAALKAEGEKTARLEGQISEMAAEQVHLQEGLRIANVMKDRLNEKLKNASTQYGLLESRMMSAREAEKMYLQKIAVAVGAREQALDSRNRILGLVRELEGKIAALDTKLHASAQENGSLEGALFVAEAEINELKSAAERLHEQSAEQFATYTVALESREERAAEEIHRIEGLWNKSMDEMKGLRMKLEDVSIAKGSLQGELEALRSGASALTASVASAHTERDKAVDEVLRLTSKLNIVRMEIDQMESRTTDASTGKGELEGVIKHLREDLEASQEAARLANEALIDHRSQSATEKAALEGHINMLATGLQDLEYQLQVAASRSTGLEEAVRSAENETLHSIAVTSPRTIAPPDMSPL
eukprot:TRINITY_DN6169_c0_g3_i1.p1 TRINITY_DN6169_c0_g3~~TRINITY_DN6169_c0_g3_i1.p1  ORF type:complete len:1318 (+),score=414.02 TRINITY_DN6169_c0_g3_i1:701-4654(+)